MSTSGANGSSETSPEKLGAKPNLAAVRAIDRLRTLLGTQACSSTSSPTLPPTASPLPSGMSLQPTPFGTVETQSLSWTSLSTDSDLSSVTLSLEEGEVGVVFKVQVGSTGLKPDEVERIRKRIRRLIRAEFFNVKVNFIRSGLTLPEHQWNMGVIFECGHEQEMMVHLEAGDYDWCKKCSLSRKVRSYGGSPVRP